MHSAVEGDRPGGTQPSPTNPPDGPPRHVTYSTLSAQKKLGVISLIAKPFQEVLAEMAAEAAEREALAAEHVKAA